MNFELTPNQEAIISNWKTKHSVHCPLKNKKTLTRYIICFASGDGEPSVYIECKCGAYYLIEDI